MVVRPNVVVLTKACFRRYQINVQVTAGNLDQ